MGKLKSAVIMYKSVYCIFMSESLKKLACVKSQEFQRVIAVVKSLGFLHVGFALNGPEPPA